MLPRLISSPSANRFLRSCIRQNHLTNSKLTKSSASIRSPYIKRHSSSNSSLNSSPAISSSPNRPSQSATSSSAITPSPSLSSDFSPTTTPTPPTLPSTESESSTSSDQPQIQPKMLVGFTCTHCSTRTHKLISKTSYEKGVVIIKCDGCEVLHLVADNLGWFMEGKNIEEMVKSKFGENARIVKVGMKNDAE